MHRIPPITVCALVVLALLLEACAPAGGRRSGTKPDSTAVVVPPVDSSSAEPDNPAPRTDSARPAAGDSVVLKSECDRVHTRTITSEGGYTESNTYYAELAIQDLDPNDPPHITALACDSSYTPPGCNEGQQCTESGDPDLNLPAPGQCWESWYVVLPGKLRVACGADSKSDFGGTVVGWSNRLQRVVVRIR